nr:MAG TPA: hypothetical protein [Caudoviricetes sp.]
MPSALAFHLATTHVAHIAFHDAPFVLNFGGNFMQKTLR